MANAPILEMREITKRFPGVVALSDVTMTVARGEIHAIYRRWFEQPLPLQGLNLKLPMSAAFRRVIANPTDSPDPERYR